MRGTLCGEQRLGATEHEEKNGDQEKTDYKFNQQAQVGRFSLLCGRKGFDRRRQRALSLSSMDVTNPCFTNVNSGSIVLPYAAGT